MSEIGLFFNVVCTVLLPISLIIIGSRFYDLYKIHFDIDKLKIVDFFNLWILFLMPFCVVMFAINEYDAFLMTLMPAFMGMVLFFLPVLIICCVEEKCFPVPCPESKVVISYLFCVVTSVAIAFTNARLGEYVIGLWISVGIGIGVMLLNLSLFLTLPLIEEIRKRKLGKTLGVEKQKLYRKEELALKKMPNAKLHELFLKYRSFTEKDYDAYKKYSANENYISPLIGGKELINFHLRIICKELNQRRYMDKYWH